MSSKSKETAQSYSPEGEKRGGADAAMLLAPLVMQVVTNPDNSNKAEIINDHLNL